MSNRIRTYAASVGHEIVGRLKCIPINGKEDASISIIKGDKLYLDEANNEYWLTKQGVCIVTCDGGVI